MARDDVSSVYAPEAEQSVLGGLLLAPDAMVRLAEVHLAAEHFADPAHRAIWATIAELDARRELVDVIAVFDRLRAAGKAEACGGLVYLNQLAACVPSATHIAAHAAIVREKALQRSVLEAADRAMAVARGSGTGAEKLDAIASQFAALAKPSSRRIPRRLSEAFTARREHWEAIAAGEKTPGWPTQLPHLDRVLGGGLKPGKVYVLAARPSVGKTSLAQQMATAIGGSGAPALICSQEMLEGELVDRAAANLGGVELEALTTGSLQHGQWSGVAQAQDIASSLPIYVDDQPALSLLDIRAKARHVQREAGSLALLVIDYLQLCAGDADAKSRHHQIEAISRGLKQLAKDLNCAVLALSQLARRATQQPDGEPQLEHLKESGAIEEDADCVLLMHPLSRLPDDRMLVLIRVAKNRGGRRMRLGLAFDGKHQRWETSTADVSARRP